MSNTNHRNFSDVCRRRFDGWGRRVALHFRYRSRRDAADWRSKMRSSIDARVVHMKEDDDVLE